MDPVADMLVIIKNGYLAKKREVLVPFSKFKFEIAKVFEKEKFIDSVKKEDKKIKMNLSYPDNTPALSDVKRVSKLGLRIFVKSKNIPQIRGGRGMVVISTSKGVMTGKDAKSKKIGGEIICKVF